MKASRFVPGPFHDARPAALASFIGRRGTGCRPVIRLRPHFAALILVLVTGCAEDPFVPSPPSDGGALHDAAAGDLSTLDLASPPDFAGTEFIATADGGLLTPETCLSRPVASCTAPGDMAMSGKDPIVFLRDLLEGCGLKMLPTCSEFSALFDANGCAEGADYVGDQAGFAAAKCIALQLNALRYPCAARLHLGLSGYCE